MTRSRFWLTLPLALLGCGTHDAAPRDQWVVTLTTDAPIPTFGDRVLVELLDDAGEPACDACRRLFDASTAEKFPLSFGIEPSAKATRVRARLYRSVIVGADGFPHGTALVDVLGRLPKVSSVTPAWLSLDARCFEVAPDLGAHTTCDPSTRAQRPEPELGPPPHPPPTPGSWAPAKSIACPDAPPSGMVCVPGGTFLLGLPTPLHLDEQAETPERVVRIAPFAIDIDELDLKTVVGLIKDGSISGEPVTKNLAPVCTFLGVDDPSNDAYPVNCISWDAADSICTALGKRLPTEAEWEYVASNAPADTAYTWGDDADVCTHAYVAHGTPAESSSVCQDAATAGNVGPVVGGMQSDVSSLGVHNLSGNVSEWVADDFAPYTDPCWDYAQFPLDNPRCDTGSTDLGRQKSVRGGWWGASPYAANVASRDYSTLKTPQVVAGVRCARSF